MRKTLAAIALLLVGWAGLGCSAHSNVISEHFYVQTPMDAQAGADSPWVLLLPGGDGLEVFGDRRVYFEAVDELASAPGGHRVCLIDYDAACAAAGNAPGGDPGIRMAWAVDQAVRWLQATGQQDPTGARIALVAWSLGAEGVWALTEQPPDDPAAQLVGAAVFFPANRQRRELMRGDVPLLIQTGAADDLTPVEPIREAIAHRPNTMLVVYEGAYHGFDAAGLPPRKRVLLFRPGLGPIVTFGYQPAAAKASHARLLTFLAELE